MNGYPVRIARIGLALEMADGSLIQVYTDQCGEATATIEQTTDHEEIGWTPGFPLRRVVTGQQTTITLAGLSAMDVRITYPPGLELEGQQAIESGTLRGASLTKAGDGTGTIALEESPHE